MFQQIRRHQKWLWAIITTLTIVSFVVWFSPQQPRLGRGYRDVTLGSINGRPIGREEYSHAMDEAALWYLFNAGDWPRSDDFTRQIMEREIRKRLLLVEKLKELNVLVSPAAVAQWISEAIQDRDQRVFRKADYDRFVKERLPQHNLSEEDFQRFVRHEVGIQHLMALTGLSGTLVTPQEAEIIYRRENEEADTQAVFLSATNYLASVTVDPAALMTFYTNQQANYRIPERVQVVYVKFEATNYLAEADQRMTALTNLSQIIEATYGERGPNAFRDTNSLPLAAEAAKEKIRDEFRQSFALVEARRKAIDFANKLIELPLATNNLANFAAAEGILSSVTEPFAEENPPPNLKVPDTFGRAAFQLTPTQPIYEQPIVAQDGVYLIGYHNRIPSEIRPFETIREQVAEEFRKSEATKLLNAAGRDLESRLTMSLAQGKTFEAACGEANVPTIDLPPFSQKTSTLPQLLNRGDLSSIKNAAFALTPGKTSSFTPTRDGGFIVYLQAKIPVTDEKVKEGLAAFMENLRRSRLYEAYGEWLRKEIDLARISLPTDKRSAN
ncbi:MAG: peptidyl-prolyl cis-trans isomerase [Verrucomicrobia bacterium]|nr:peptidyl-prolyl cis-trans isomerase [Verrucomicrobiota bacterium]